VFGGRPKIDVGRGGNFDLDCKFGTGIALDYNSFYASA